MGSLFNNFFEKGQDDNEPAEVEYKGEEPESSEKVKITGKILGRVQGVGFRYTAKQSADDLNINGMVQNESDGSVYVEAVGTKEEIDQFITSLAKGPSPSASVDKVIIEYDESIKERNGFGTN